MGGRHSKPLTNPPNRVREVRERLGVSQDDVGRACRVTGEQVRKWEVGENEMTIARLEMVARYLRVLPHTLLRDYKPAVDGAEEAALAAFRILSPDDRERALKLLQALAPQEAPPRRAVS